MATPLADAEAGAAWLRRAFKFLMSVSKGMNSTGFTNLYFSTKLHNIPAQKTKGHHLGVSQRTREQRLDVLHESHERGVELLL